MENNKKIISGKSYNEYHIDYYRTTIKGKKKQCECGLLVDVYRYNRHLKTNKHIRNLNLINLQNLEIIEKNI